MCRCAVDTHQIVQSVKSIIEEVVVRKNIRSMIMNNTTPFIKKIRFHHLSRNLCANSYGIKYIFKHTFHIFLKTAILHTSTCT